MPRQGDGSSDNGPIEGNTLIHGASGDDTIQHTKKVAPPPPQEKGAGLEGLPASGGGSAGITGANVKVEAVDEVGKK
ncbi:hypothetical protein B0J11DRAFT_515667 [Dendryphion nanum]|uniref:Uncharacterized protein n=1 Tax=Dendryphion nanum TaxID=256645 RepID=A0A9P9IX52_9PLEO|nr:hypothetical protein B0J11DRAFT_515667 [Dendryphion nanum]